jgi:hypothetical protein
MIQKIGELPRQLKRAKPRGAGGVENDIDVAFVRTTIVTHRSFTASKTPAEAIEHQAWMRSVTISI